MKILLLLLTTVASHAQYSLGWSTADAGGGDSSGGTFRLEGTIAQVDAAPPAASGTYSIEPGYWTFPDTAPPLPDLSLRLDNGLSILMWSAPVVPVVLEYTTDLDLWQPVDPPPVENFYIEPESARRFYRLRPGP